MRTHVHSVAIVMWLLTSLSLLAEIIHSNIHHRFSSWGELRYVPRLV